MTSITRDHLKHWQEAARNLRLLGVPQGLEEDLAIMRARLEQQVIKDARVLLKTHIGTPAYLRLYALVTQAIENTTMELASAVPVSGKPEETINIEQLNAYRWWLAGQLNGMTYARDLATAIVAEAERIRSERKAEGKPDFEYEEEAAHAIHG